MVGAGTGRTRRRHSGLALATLHLALLLCALVGLDAGRAQALSVHDDRPVACLEPAESEIAGLHDVSGGDGLAADTPPAATLVDPAVVIAGPGDTGCPIQAGARFGPTTSRAHRARAPPIA